MRQLMDGISDIRLEYVRAFVLEDSPAGSTTLVDTGFDRTADYLIETLREAVGNVDRVVLTHDGGDHYGGLDAVMAAFDPELCAPAGETDLLAAIDHRPDIAFEDGDVLDGDIEIIQVPGHSIRPSALLLRERGVLISGDVLDGADRRGLPAGYLLPPPETFNHDHGAAERNLEKLLGYDFDAVLVFHGSHVLDDAKDKLERFLSFKDHYRQDLLDAWDERA